MQKDERLKNVDDATRLRAAQYVRMSTDNQRYSIQNQADAISVYATQWNLLIVRNYEDEGHSGLRFENRNGLKTLISDVIAGRTDFEVILVYDVSRWGRFQDADESAHYEFICKEAGLRVEYCAEDFKNDGSFVSNLAKHLKREMAGEYSRQLSAKVFAAQCRHVNLGFWQGGPAAFGLRRQLIDENGNSKGLLTRGQRKHLQSDRVILGPGTPQELQLVREIFRQFVDEGKTEAQIARELNRDGITNHHGRRWTSWYIRFMLMNENYIGNIVYNRRTERLRQPTRHNSPNLWIRKTGVLEPIVDPLVFRQAQQSRMQRRLYLSDRELLSRLSSLQREKGTLSAKLIDEADFLPCCTTYTGRFGSLRNAYKLIEYRPKGNFDYIDREVLVAAAISNLASEIVTKLSNCGSVASFDEETSILTINRGQTVSIFPARCRRSAGHWLRWTVLRRVNLCSDLIIAPRFNRAANNVIDYLLLPVANFPRERMEFSERNQARLDACRFETVDALVRSVLDPSCRPAVKRRFLPQRQGLTSR